jgi:hypothetical protein
MRNHIVSFASFVVLLLLGLTAESFGQTRYGLEIGGFAGGTFWQTKTFQIGPPQASPPFDMQFKYDDKIAGGIRGNFLSVGHWGGELSYSYQKNQFTLTREASSFPPTTLKGGVHQFFYNQIYYLNRYEKSTIQPFVTGGLGVADYTLDTGSRDWAADPNQGGIGVLRSSEAKFALNYGAGIKWQVGRRFGIRGDFRHNFSQAPHYGLPESSSNPSQVVFPLNGWIQNFEVTGGIYFRTSKQTTH